MAQGYQALGLVMDGRETRVIALQHSRHTGLNHTIDSSMRFQVNGAGECIICADEHRTGLVILILRELRPSINLQNRIIFSFV